LSLLSGCPEIWLPAAERTSRDEVKEGSKLGIDVGKTTRIDVLLALGEPDGRASDDSSFTYESTRSWAVGLYPVAGGEVTLSRLVISFNDDGVVSKVDFRRHKCPVVQMGTSTGCAID
jgi:hypothetical protein